MASTAVEPISVENDSVIYEHIIPRSVRQKWMKRTSTGHLDLILTSPRDRMKFKKPEQIVINSVKLDTSSKGQEYGDSIVSHDVHNLKDNSNDFGNSRSESLITPEEEKAVFNAFGVKLRHTGGQSVTKYISSGPPEGNDNASKSATEIDAKQIEESRHVKQDVDSTKGIEKNTASQIKFRGITRKPRPLSMPSMSDKIEKHHQMQADDLSMSKPKPKAYISPHAKVPWKRNIARKTIETMESNSRITKSISGEENEQENDAGARGTVSTDNETLHYEGRNSIGKLSNPHDSKTDEYSKLKLNHQENYVEYRGPGGNNHDSKFVATEEIVNAMHSVSERRKPFEKYDGTGHSGVAGSYSKHFVPTNTGNAFEEACHDGIIDNENKLILSDNGKQHGERQASEEESLKKLDAANIEKAVYLGKIGNDLSVQQASVSKDLGREKKKKYSSSDEGHQKLLNIFQSMPVYKPDYTEEKSIDIALKEERKAKGNLNNDSSSNIDKNIVLTVGKKYEKKVKKMMIMTGEQRDRELKSKPKPSENKKVPKENKNKMLHTSACTTDNLNEAKVDADIPVTNLDDTIPVLTHNHNKDIPVTNLDDLPAINGFSSLQAKANQKSSPKHPTSAPPKRPGKYDADRRELVAPKIVFENPVTGLISALSPKEKTNRKKKMRVSFLSNDMATVHTYPSESLAMEMYDESDCQNNSNNLANNGEKSIDDVIANEGNAADFQCYIPSSFSDLTGTLERERRTIARQNEMIAEKEHKTDKTQLSTLEKSNSVFTETSTGETNAILF